MLQFNTCDWYWIKKDGTVFHSGRQREFPGNDLDYLNWLSRGGIPKPYPVNNAGEESREMMNEILYPYGRRVYPLTPEEAERELEAIEAGVMTRFAANWPHGPEAYIGKANMDRLEEYAHERAKIPRR